MLQFFISFFNKFHSLCIFFYWFIYINKVNGSNVSKAYKGSAYTINDILSEIIITTEDGDRLDNTNFEINFGGISPKDAGIYTVLISGKTGTAYENVFGTATFTITAVTFSVGDVEDIPYHGVSYAPELTITGLTGETLEEGIDYTLSYAGTDSEGANYTGTIAPINVGSYSVTVVGKGNYRGSVTKTFNIHKTSICFGLNDNIDIGEINFSKFKTLNVCLSHA